MDSYRLSSGDSHIECFCNSMGLKSVSFNSPSEMANTELSCLKN